MSASKKVEAFVIALEIKLLMIGVDPTLIVLRGPTVAMLGVALSILAYLFHRVQSQMDWAYFNGKRSRLQWFLSASVRMASRSSSPLAPQPFVPAGTFGANCPYKA